MFKSKLPLPDRVEALKHRKDRKYYELSLRDDLAQLIAVGMSRQPGLTQRMLTHLAGWKWESYVSRLVNAGANFKIGAAVRVLIPLGIVPRLVDAAEWNRLQALADAAGTVAEEADEVIESKYEVVQIETTSNTSRFIGKGINHGRHQRIFRTAGSGSTDTSNSVQSRSAVFVG